MSLVPTGLGTEITELNWNAKQVARSYYSYVKKKYDCSCKRFCFSKTPLLLLGNNLSALYLEKMPMAMPRMPPRLR